MRTAAPCRFIWNTTFSFAAAGAVNAGEVIAQRLADPVWVVSERAVEELDDGRYDAGRELVERADGG